MMVFFSIGGGKASRFAASHPRSGRAPRERGDDPRATMMTGWDDDRLGYDLVTLDDEFDMGDFGFDLDDLDAEVEDEAPFAECLDEESECVSPKFGNHEDYMFVLEFLVLELAPAPWCSGPSRVAATAAWRIG